MFFSQNVTLLPRKTLLATAAAAAFLMTYPGSASAAAHAKHGRSHGYARRAAVVEQSFTLHLHHLHTGETLNIVYKVGDEYVAGAVEKLNYFLRDHRTNDVSHYDPREFDLLHSVMKRLGRPNGVIDVVCGYRSPESNEYLRTRAEETGVARNSQHVLAKAIDIRVPGVRTRRLRDAALALKVGGVGYYPVSQFVHVDVGPVRTWTYRGSGD